MGQGLFLSRTAQARTGSFAYSPSMRRSSRSSAMRPSFARISARRTRTAGSSGVALDAAKPEARARRVLRALAGEGMPRDGVFGAGRAVFCLDAEGFGLAANGEGKGDDLPSPVEGDMWKLLSKRKFERDDASPNGIVTASWGARLLVGGAGEIPPDLGGCGSGRRVGVTPLAGDAPGLTVACIRASEAAVGARSVEPERGRCDVERGIPVCGPRVADG